MENLLGLWVGHDAAEVGGSVVADSCAKNNSFGALFVEDLEHLTKWEGAADIGVENEESIGVAFEDSITEVVETASCPQSLVFSEVLYADLGKFSSGILDEVTENMLFIVAD